MALLTDASSTAWSSAVVLAANEFWQCRTGAVLISTATTPGVNDGILLTAPYGIDLLSGASVKYKAATTQASTISREAL